jgi:hypothetical protein
MMKRGVVYRVLKGLAHRRTKIDWKDFSKGKKAGEALPKFVDFLRLRLKSTGEALANFGRFLVH